MNMRKKYIKKSEKGEELIRLKKWNIRKVSEKKIELKFKATKNCL